MKKDLTQKQCLNCDAFFTGDNDFFCRICGQKRNGYLISIRDFTGEILSNIFSWDNRFWRTLWFIFVKPGKVAKEYTEGVRVRYTNPFRLYFIASIICFLLQSLLLEIGFFEDFHFFKVENLSSISIDNRYLGKTTIFKIWNEVSVNPSKKPDEILDRLGYEHTRFKHWLAKRFKVAQRGLRGDDFRERIVKKMISIVPLMIFLMLPLIALCLKLLYIRINYVCHLVFAFQVQTMFFFLFFGASLIAFFASTTFETILFYVFLLYLVHIFIAFKRFYAQSIFKTLVKFLITNVFIFIFSLNMMGVTVLSALFFLD